MKLIKSLIKYAKKQVKEVKDLGATELTLEGAEVDITGPKLSFKINVEREAAWKLYVELNTRIATQSLQESEGILREALTSLYSVFGITREILKEAGPVVAQGDESLGFYAMGILNQVLRPILSKWHPELSHWEEQRDPRVSLVEHEREWKHASLLRKELEKTQEILLEYCEALAILARISTKGE